MMEIVWFKRAIWDLQSAKNYISQDNPLVAQHIVQRFKNKVSLLSEQPSIEILRVLHSSRRWPTKI